jgi:hypothetical protein
VKRSIASETLLECCGETLAAVALSLAAEGPDALVLASALYALANAAEGASMLLQAAAADLGPGEALDVDVAGLDALLRARDAIDNACSLVNAWPVEDCPT